MHLGSLLKLQIPGPYDKDSDPEDVGKEGGLDNVWLPALQGDSDKDGPPADDSGVGSTMPGA